MERRNLHGVRRCQNGELESPARWVLLPRRVPFLGTEVLVSWRIRKREERYVRLSCA
jgi:hypothetical protein